MQILAGTNPSGEKQGRSPDNGTEIERLVFEHKALFEEKYHEYFQC